MSVVRRPRTAAISGTAASRRLPRLLPRPSTLLALLLYVAYAVHMTWPVVIHLGDTVYGAPGDLTGSIALLRETVEGHHNPFLPGTLHDFNAPEGLPIDWRFNLSQWPLIGVMYLLALVGGAAAAFSIATLLGYVGSGLAMFLLTRKLTGNAWAALIAGWAFAFYPFAELNGQGHNAHVHGWVFVLMAWRGLAVHEKPTIRNGVLLGLSAVLAMAFNPYFLLFGAVLLAVIAVWEIGYGWLNGRDRRRFTAAVLAVALGVGYAGVLAALTLGGTGSSPLREHSSQELTVYSARAIEYVMPPAGNLIVGDRTASYLASHLHGSNASENTLYLGVTMLLLALVGVVLAVRRPKASRQWYAVGLFLAIAVVAFVFSAPPKVNVGPLLLPTPSDLISHVTSTWRAYSRFVIIVMLGVSVLAGFGLAQLSARLGRVGGVALLAAATVLVPLDLINRQASGVISTLSDQPAYKLIENQPKGIVAQYPLYPNGYGDYGDIFFQGFHDMPVINGYAGTAQENRDVSLASLADPATVPALATLGVKYLVVTEVPTQPPVVAPGVPPAADVQFLGRAKYGGSTARVYRVTARPQPLVSATDGFGSVEGTAPNQAQWLMAPVGKLAVTAACQTCSGTLRFRLATMVQPRMVTIRDARGQVVWRRSVQPGVELKATVPIQISHGQGQLAVSTVPGIQEAPGPDPRSMSVMVIDLRARVVTP
ncbi:hypothetical protein FSW04_00745 [Baekduia soli]|uniref:DUF6311 domain-containing protein n=1 Tax=Baekduia soli TaxID=496014 RepID=A0A5B8TZU7_9ACTN|nr:hypothetical protein [Baekduia soli]QEC46243.1 hypothetical protein FSW04_00745 [Baekduia soli]